jgi:phospholipase/carboxylesterase
MHGKIQGIKKEIDLQPLETLEICPTSEVKNSVIWMHGLGADGHDFEPVVNMLELPLTRFILPHAPVRAVTLNNGYHMPAWYDIFGLDAGSKQDQPGIEQSRLQIDSLIAKEIARGIPAEHIVLAGFSQGGAIALHTGLRYPQKLAGIVALSTYLPLKPSLASQAAPANHDIPIFMAHGTFDDVISLQTNRLSRDAIQMAGYQLEWHEYPIAHSVNEDEINDLRKFLRKVFTLDQA